MLNSDDRSIKEENESNRKKRERNVVNEDEKANALKKRNVAFLRGEFPSSRDSRR